MHTFYPVAPLKPHYVVVTTGSAGDLFPFLKLAEGLRQRGFPVTFVAPDLHAPMVARTALAFHGTPVDPAVLRHPDLWHPKRGFAIVWRAVRPGMKALLPLIRNLPDVPCVIVAHPLALPEADACRAVRPDLQVAVAYLAPSNIATVYDPLVMGPWKVPRWIPHAVRRWLWRQVGKRLIDPVVLPDINADRAALGLAPVNGLFDLMAHAPDLSVTLFPEWFGARQPDWPTPLVCGEFALYDPDPDAAFSAELSQFLAAGEAPIVFTHGTGNHQASAYFACALDAVTRLGKRAIFLTGLPEQVPAGLPPTVLWQAYLPFKALLPHAAALVHHGGIGTTAEALRAGVPQLIVALAFDQFDNAARVEALGAGLGLPHRQLSPARLASVLQRLVSSSSIRDNTRAVAARLTPVPSLDSLLDAISDMAKKMGKN
ncbi:glycosyltransferase [Massilia sp. CF038]|uniref:glycosyltransferase n=1 Tax=Massilia sp. CF038 TaxID=1881045 RepID=UPI001E52D262|nr:nucleotide disphospho-sugar-binding domain-containing protein [Massilia sp. CF038]